MTSKSRCVATDNLPHSVPPQGPQPYYWFLENGGMTPGNVPPTLQFAEGDTACSNSLSEKFVIGVCNGESDGNGG